jgi:ElaB/YqjD/DUF883 family membrane-anchored ribosome-binding protein
MDRTRRARQRALTRFQQRDVLRLQGKRLRAFERAAYRAAKSTSRPSVLVTAHHTTRQPMDIDTTFTTPRQDVSDLTNKAADNLRSGLRSTQDTTNAAFDRLSDTLDSAREQVAPALDRMTERAIQLSDTTASRIRDEPLKAMLIAAATGAALMALVTMVGRAGSDRY